MSIGELASKIEVTAERLREIETGETGETGETCVEIRRARPLERAAMCWCDCPADGSRA